MRPRIITPHSAQMRTANTFLQSTSLRSGRRGDDANAMVQYTIVRSVWGEVARYQSAKLYGDVLCVELLVY